MFVASFCCRNVSFMLKINMIVLFVLVSVLSAFVETASTESEEADPCQGKVGIFPNPDDCTTYLICQNGISEIADCPDGLLFDRYKRTCDRNVTVDCSDAGASDLPPYQTGVRSDDVLCESNNCSCIYPSKTSCSQYYRCEDGIAYLEQCSEGLLMNPETFTCDYAEDVSCAISAEVGQEDPCQGKTGVFSNPDDCTTYLICQNGISEIVNCPDGLLFDRYKRTCDRNATVACSDAGATDLPPYQTGVRSDDVVCESNNCSCIYPSNTSCSQYYRCEDGIAYIEQCSEGLLMNPETLTCDYAEDVACDISPSYDTSSPTITAYYLSSSSDLEDDNEILSSTKEEEKNNESEESTLYPTSEITSVIRQNPFTDGNTGDDFDENDRGTTVILTSEAEFSGNTVGDDAVTASEAYSLPDSTDGTAFTGIVGKGTFSQPSTAVPENITSEDGTSASFTQTERDLLTTVMSTVTKYFFSDTPSETSSETYPTTKETSENNVKTDVQSVSTSESITLTAMPYKTPVNAESTLSASSTLSTGLAGELTPTEIPSAIATGESETYFVSEKTSSENGQITEQQNLTSESKSTSIDEISENTIHTSPTEFIKSEDKFSQETTSSGITDSSVKSTTPVSVVYRSTDSELSFDDTTANDNLVYTKDSSTISHDIVELSTLHINQTQNKNPDEVEDASNLPINFNVTTTPEEPSTRTIADEGRSESEIMTNVPSLEVTDSSEKEHLGTDAINETADTTTNFIDLTSNIHTEAFTSETESENLIEKTRVSESVSNLGTESFSPETAPERSTVNEVTQYTTATEADISSVETIGETVIDSTTKVTETTSAMQFTSPSRESSSISAKTDISTVKNPTVITSTSRSAASEIVTEPRTDLDTSESKTETRSEISESESIPEVRTETFTSETGSESNILNGTFTEYSTTASSIDSTETVIINSIPTTTEHFIVSTTEQTEVTSESQNPTSITKLTAPSKETSSSTSADLETSTNTQSTKVTLLTKTSASDVVTPSNEVESETQPKTLTSNSVANFPSDPFTSESTLESSTAADIRTTTKRFSKESTETESVDAGSVPLTTRRVLDFTTEFTEVTSETQNQTFIPEFTRFTERTSSIITESETSTSTVTEPTINPSTSENTGSVVVTETRTEASTPETVTETETQTFPSKTTPDSHTESFTSEISLELNRTADVTQHTTESLSRQSIETESSTVPFVSAITEQFIDSTTDFTEVTSRRQHLTSVTKFTTSPIRSSTIITESESNKLTTIHSNTPSTVSNIVTESLSETSSSDIATVTQTKTVSPETASETMSETVSSLHTDPSTSETATDTSSIGKTNVTTESTVTESVIISSLPTTISLPTSVIKSTAPSPGSPTITTGSETLASTNMGTVTSTLEIATSSEETETSTESATLETMTEAQSKTSSSDLVSDLPTESLTSESVPESSTVNEDLTQYATTDDTGRSSENGSSTITSAPIATESFIDFTTELPEVISETENPESITKFVVSSEGISNNVTDSETNISKITRPVTITSITGSTASAVATATRTESVTPKIVTKTQTETSGTETESDIFTDSFTTRTVSEMNSATESNAPYKTKSTTEENTETESLSTSVPTVTDKFIGSTTEFTKMTSQNATYVTTFTATSQTPSGSVTDSEPNTSTTIISATDSITSAVVTEIRPESATPETVTETRDKMSPSETVTDFLTKPFTSETIAETDNPTEDIAQYTTSVIIKNETETEIITIASTPTTAERLVDTTTETKKPIVTKFTSPFEKTSSTTAESEINMSTTEEPTSFISTGSTTSETDPETRSETPNPEKITVSQEETISDFPTKSFSISEIRTPTENVTKYTTKSTATENTETESLDVSMPRTTQQFIDSTTEFTEVTSKTEEVTSVTKSTATSQGFSSTVTEPTNTSTAVVIEIRTESATPETVTETGREMPPSETATNFLTKSFTSETIAETDKPTEDITQYTATSSISETESITIALTQTTAERLVDTTTESKKPIVTKFTAPFEKTSSATAKSEIDMSTTEEPTFISTGSTASETRSESPNLGTITVSQEETISDFPTTSFTTISERSTPTENVTQYTTKSIGTENTETQPLSVSLPTTSERFIDSTTEFTEGTSEKVTSITKSTVTSQGFSSTITETEADNSTITAPTNTYTAGSTSAVVTEIRTESVTPETVTETRGEMSPSETVTDFLTKSFTSETIPETDNPTENITQYTATSRISETETETESITVALTQTTAERLVDTTTETKKPIVTKFTAPFEKTSSAMTESEIDMSTTEEQTFISTGSTTSETFTETRSEFPNLETITVSPEQTISDFPTKSFTTISERSIPTENVTQYTTEGIITANTETQPISDSVPTTSKRFIDSTTEFTEVTSEKVTSVTKSTVTSQGFSSTIKETEADNSTITAPTNTYTAGSTSAVVTEIRTESVTPETVTETRGEMSPSETVTDFLTKSFTSETIPETDNPTEDITQYTATSRIIETETETESITIALTQTTAEQIVDTTTETKKPIVTKFTVPFEKTSTTTVESEIDMSTTEEPISFISSESTASATVTERLSETPNLGTITVSQEVTVSDFPTKSFSTISEISTPTENITQYTTKSINTERTENESLSVSVPATTERLIDSTTEFIATSKTEAISTTKSTVTPLGFSSTITEPEANISTVTEPRTITSTTESTSAVVTEIRTESATPESVTETKNEMSPSETASNLHTEPVAPETGTESKNPTEGFTQYTSSDISKKETESINVTSAPTTTERFIDSTTETKKPTVTKFTAPFERTSSITAESEIDISTTVEPMSFSFTAGSTTSAIVTETRTGSAIPETITETRAKTVTDLFTDPFITKSISDSNTATENITRYTTKGFSRDNTETESVKISSVPTSTDRLVNSTTEITEMTSETRNPSTFTASSQSGSTSTATESERNISTITDSNIVTSTAESTSFSVVTTFSTESATPGTMTETASETSAFVTMSDWNTQPSTSKTALESKYTPEDITEYTTKDVSKKNNETKPSITTAVTTAERFTDSPAEFTDVTSTFETVLETRFPSSTYVTSSESGTVSEVKESTTISTMCLDSNGMYPHPTDCQAFYKCTEGVPVLSFCVGDEHFNPRDHLCQDPCLALCDNTIDCSGMTQSPSSVTTEEFSISGNINTTLMTDGTSYRTTETNDFTNDSSTPSDNEVSSTSIVSEVTSVEDNSTETEISTLPTSPETFTSFRTTLSDISSTRSSEETNNSPISVFSTTTTGPSNFMSTTVYDIDRTEWPICQDPNGLYPNPNDCRSFFMCIGGEPYETQCDEQLHFSPLTQRCEFPCIAKCDPALDCSSTHPPIATSAVPFIKCPQKDFFPVFEQCDYYFDCVGTFPRIQSCPVGLTFNATTRVCDWPENAECGSSVKPLPESDDGYDCPCETCLVPSMSNCKDYYLCFNYKAYPMECSNGLLFDQSLNTCNYQSKTLCNIASSTTITTTSTTTTTALPSSTTQSYKCPERNGMFRDPSNCRRFIHCSNYWPYTKDCPGGLHFSVELQRCEWPCEAKCDLTLPCVDAQQTPTPLRLPSTTPDPLCPCKNCRVSNPESCTKYVECTNGISKRKNCPRGQTFDHQRQRCDWAHKVDCPYSQICPRSNGLFLYKDDCHKFVHCSNGIPYIKTCPSGLEFDPRTLRCEWPSGKCVSAKPELSSRAEEIDEQLLQEEIDEELFQEKWTCPEKFGYFPHETSCSKFYQCSFGTPHLKECSDDLSYNPLYQTCDWQKNVKCGSHQQHYRRRCRRYDRQILCPQNKTHVAHPHCDMFYDCSTGSPCPKRCPNGLFFNSITHMCDTAENVNCLKRDGEVYSLKNMAEACHRKGKGQMQDPANDSCFYKCHNHKVIRGCCSRNRIFNEKSNNCMLKTFIPPNLRIFG